MVNKVEGNIPSEEKGGEKYPSDRVPTNEEYNKQYDERELIAIGPIFAAHIYAQLTKKFSGFPDFEAVRNKLDQVFGYDVDVDEIAKKAVDAQK